MRAVFTLTLIVLASLLFIGTASAEGSDIELDLDSNDVVTTDTTKQGVIGASSQTYTAQPGDSVTLLARQLISSYSESTNVDLNPAQAVYAETVLTQSTNTQPLAIGQMVSFDMNQVQTIIEDAQNLSQSELAAWQPWANLAGLS